MASAGAVCNDDSASLLVGEQSPPPAVSPAAGSSPLQRLLHGGKKKQKTTRPATTTTTSTRSHDVKRFICSPFAAVFRAMSCARDAAVRTCDEQQPSNNNNGTAAMRRRPSLEQLLRMEAPPPPPPTSARPDHHQQQRNLVGKPREAAVAAVAPYEVIPSCAVKGKKDEQEPPAPVLPSAPRSHFVATASDDDGELRRRTTAVPVKLEAGAGGRQTNAKRLVVVLASLRACSRAPRINDGKVKVAAARRGSGKAELFYYRPIPMGRRCRVQHLEESPYGASSDLSSLLELGQVSRCK